MRGVTAALIADGAGGRFQLTRLMRGVTVSPSGAERLLASFQLTRLMRGVTANSKKIARNV